MNATSTLSRTLSDTIASIETSLVDVYESTTTKFADQASDLNDEFSARLAEIEGRVPELPKKVVAYNRVAAERAFAQVRRNNELLVDALRPVVKIADTGVRTVVGTTKWAIEQTASTATTGARTVIGQAKAQAKRTVDTLNDQAVDAVDQATRRVVAADRAANRVAVKSMTKAELLEIANERDIAGRSTMTKPQLIAAING